MAADISHDSMSSEDKLEIMIRSMMQDIQELKMEQRNTRDLKMTNSYNSIIIELKPGITKKEIAIVMKNIENQCKVPITWSVRNGKLYTDLECDVLRTFDIWEEIDRLGIICL